jgi:hypothetical protein
MSQEDLAELGGPLTGRHVVLDGEIVAFNVAAVQTSARSEPGCTFASPPGGALAAVPAFFVAFDVLHLDGWSTQRMSYEARRGLLDQIGLDAPRVQVPPYFRQRRRRLPHRPRAGPGRRGLQAAGLPVPARPIERPVATQPSSSRPTHRSDAATSSPASSTSTAEPPDPHMKPLVSPTA